MEFRFFAKLLCSYADVGLESVKTAGFLTDTRKSIAWRWGMHDWHSDSTLGAHVSRVSLQKMALLTWTWRNDTILDRLIAENQYKASQTSPHYLQKLFSRLLWNCPARMVLNGLVLESMAGVASKRKNLFSTQTEFYWSASFTVPLSATALPIQQNWHSSTVNLPGEK